MGTSTEEVSHGTALKDSPFIACETHKCWSLTCCERVVCLNVVSYYYSIPQKILPQTILRSVWEDQNWINLQIFFTSQFPICLYKQAVPQMKASPSVIYFVHKLVTFKQGRSYEFDWEGRVWGGGGWVGAKVLAISGIGISTFYGIEISTIFEIEIMILSSVMDWLMEWKGARALAFFGIGILIFDGIEISTIFRIEAKILNSILDWLLEWNILIPVCIDTPFLILTLGIYIDMHTHMTHDIVKLNESIICNGFNIMF